MLAGSTFGGLVNNRGTCTQAVCSLLYFCSWSVLRVFGVEKVEGKTFRSPYGLSGICARSGHLWRLACIHHGERLSWCPYAVAWPPLDWHFVGASH
eukprot:2931250-Amphidinium_carterae.2